MKIEFLGEYVTDVYDITVEGNKNFYGNGILVSNCDTDSLYVSNVDLIEKFFGKGVTPDRHKAEKVLDEFYAKKVEPVLEKAYTELAERMGAFENAMGMKREKINDLAVFCLHPDTKVLVDKDAGKYLRIEDLHATSAAGLIPSLDVVTGSLVDDFLHASAMRHHDGDMIRLTNEEGDVLMLTPEHEVYTLDGWTMAGHLDNGDYVAYMIGDMAYETSVTVEYFHYSGPVYDISVRDNANFITEGGFVVHNCGKKRYILNTLNSEGVHYPTPKLSVTGIESVRSSTPRVVRKKMEDMFKILMKQDEGAAQDFIAEFYQDFQQLPLADIAKNSGIEDVTKNDPKLADLVTKSNHNGLMWDGEDYVEMDNSAHGAGVGVIYAKGTPIHVRGALLFNHHIKRLGLENKYEPIQSGDKIQFVYLKVPNPIGENVISFFGDIPPELGLGDYVDYQTQFEKVFLHPMKNIMSAVGWSPEKVSTLDDFFS